ncbi:hypothetical protein NIES4075_01880 [Tolypothrix sp. NIES-4075]|uniref:type II toxin-antitoxin system MazE family antitoxin n=1 Tax=Tolypothrix sp. NIES-4075 TaxID=2005459 RepID=UPI000B5C1CE0|nr:CopG family transcriptional regulator [Tolypothrix sp. NIES-4075]GAX39237.1 hypothetical protein NIES4075_01880 [Tolypothrix sp. NIES-4075]
MVKVSITLEEDILQFIDQQAQGNRSGYINALLSQHCRRLLEAEMIASLKQDAEDREYQAAIAAWDNVVGDGINASY